MLSTYINVEILNGIPSIIHQLLVTMCLAMVLRIIHYLEEEMRLLVFWIALIQIVVSTIFSSYSKMIKVALFFIIFTFYYSYSDYLAGRKSVLCCVL